MFTSIGYDIKPGGSKAFETDVNEYYPNLSKGRYRISKSFFYDKDIPVTREEEHLIYKEFVIE